jgi:hypothetical protein
MWRLHIFVACGSGIVQTSSWQYQCDFVQPSTLIQGPSTMTYDYTRLGGLGSAYALDLFLCTGIPP